MLPDRTKRMAAAWKFCRYANGAVLIVLALFLLVLLLCLQFFPRYKKVNPDSAPSVA